MTNGSDNPTPTDGNETDVTDDGPSQSADQSSPADDVETPDAEDNDEGEDTSHLSVAYVALIKFAFPVAGLVLAVLYVENTYGRIRFSNLYYPYFVISMVALFTATVVVDEIRDLRGRSPTVSFVNSVQLRAAKWKRSIGLVVIGVFYIGTIELVGFFPSSFAGMIAIMALGGLRDPKTMVGVTLLVLVLVYLLFIQIMGLQPPEGVLAL